LSKFKQPLQPPTQSWKASLRAVGTFDPLITLRSSLARILVNSEVVNADTEEMKDARRNFCGKLGEALAATASATYADTEDLSEKDEQEWLKAEFEMVPLPPVPEFPYLAEETTSKVRAEVESKLCGNCNTICPRAAFTAAQQWQTQAVQ